MYEKQNLIVGILKKKDVRTSCVGYEKYNFYFILCINFVPLLFILLVCACRWDIIQEGNNTFKDMDRLVAYEKGLNTWAKWIDDNVDINKTRVFFQGVSPDHLK